MDLDQQEGKGTNQLIYGAILGRLIWSITTLQYKDNGGMLSLLVHMSLEPVPDLLSFERIERATGDYRFLFLNIRSVHHTDLGLI